MTLNSCNHGMALNSMPQTTRMGSQYDFDQREYLRRMILDLQACALGKGFEMGDVTYFGCPEVLLGPTSCRRKRRARYFLSEKLQIERTLIN